MSTKALVVIDIQNDITKHYRDIVENINAAIDWAVSEGMHVVYIKHLKKLPEMLAYYAKQGCELITLHEISIPFVTESYHSSQIEG